MNKRTHRKLAEEEVVEDAEGEEAMVKSKPSKKLSTLGTMINGEVLKIQIDN